MEGWYMREENNGWRPVSVKVLSEADEDPVAKATAKLRKDFHYSRVKRGQDLRKRRKEKKREWMRKLYMSGLAREREDAAPSAMTSGGAAAALEGDDWEEDTDDLLTWSAALDYDTYVDDWRTLATSETKAENAV